MKKSVCKKSYSPLILFLILAVFLVRIFLAAVFAICLVAHVGLTESAEPAEPTELTESVRPTEPTESTGPTVLYGTYDPSEDTETGVYTETTGSGNIIQHPTIAGCDIGESFSLNMVTNDFSIKLETTEFSTFHTDGTRTGVVGARLYYKDVYVANLCYSNVYDFGELQDANAWALWTGVFPIGGSDDPTVDTNMAQNVIEVNGVRLGDKKSSVIEQLGKADNSTKNEIIDIMNYIPRDSIHYKLQFAFDDSEKLAFFQINYN